jgi:hypothetical protein
MSINNSYLVKVHIAYGGRIVRDLIRDGYREEKRRGDEVHVLAWVREQANRAEK